MISFGAELTIHEWRDKSQHTCKKNSRKLKSTTIFSPKAEHNGGATNQSNQNECEENSEGGGL
jgi:hypothetical protein